MVSPTLTIFLPNLAGGGAERMMVNLANEFSVKGIEVEILLSNKNGVYFDEISESVSTEDLNASEYPGFAALGAYLPLKKYLIDKEPDIFLSALTIINVVSLLTYHTTDVDTKIVISQRNNLTNNVKNMGMPAKWILPWLVKVSYPWADHIIPISEGVSADLRNKVPVADENMTTIYNPVVTDNIPEKAREIPDHSWFINKKDQSPIILGAGRLTKQKDFETLIKAFEKVRRNYQCRLVILGKGDRRDDLMQLANDLGVKSDVSLPGFVENPFSYMSSADIFVLSSAWEGFGNVLVEAMVCGTPVVSTDCPSGPSEILQDGELGPIVPVGDHQKLAKAIGKTLEDPIPEEKLLERADQFKVSTIAGKYISAMNINIK